jgi:hypothetical protein
MRGRLTGTKPLQVEQPPLRGNLRDMVSDLVLPGSGAFTPLPAFLADWIWMPSVSAILANESPAARIAAARSILVMLIISPASGGTNHSVDPFTVSQGIVARAFFVKEKVAEDLSAVLTALCKRRMRISRRN